MARRLKLLDELKNVLGINNCYFQPPESIKLSYPCVIYKMDTGDTQFADDTPFTFRRRYELIVISKDPDDELIDKIAYHFPMSRFGRFYTSDNLNHWTFQIYY